METTRISVLVRVKDFADRTAWQEFDSIYRPILNRYARACGLAPADADDVVQHCLSALIEHVRGFEYDPGKGRFRGWLRTLVNNHVRNRLRRRRERLTDDAALDAVPDAAEPPEDEFDRIWMQEHLRHCLSLMAGEFPRDQFDAFRAHAVAGASVEETCQRFGLTPNQLYKLKWKVTRRLSDVMREQFGDETP